MADDDSSDLSSLSSLSPAPSDDEMDVELTKEQGILKFFHKVPKGDKPALEVTPPPRKRSPSPPHDEVLADNQDIAFIVTFRNKFNEVFPKNLADFGPQELESDVASSVPGDRAEHFLCAVLKLLLNRQQDVKPGHYNRALEEAVHVHKPQWPRQWVESPLAGGKSFASMNPTERLDLLRALILWALSSSKSIRDIIDHAYKGKRQEEDSNIPLAVQSWGSDSDKRRYYLIEGLDDTSFRVYRESNPAGFTRTWWSVAGSIDDIKALSEKLETKDGGPKAKRLARKLVEEIPRFEATEEKRKRREYRQLRKEQFRRPEPGFSLYEGRTRGKRMKYTYSDDEDFLSESTGHRRSARNTRGHTPAEPSGPVTTASGRQIRAPHRLNGETRSNGESSAAAAGGAQGDHDGDVEMADTSVGPTGRPRRSAAVNHSTNGWPANKPARGTAEYNSQEEEEEEEEDDDSEPDLGDDEDEHVPDESEMDDEEFDEEGLDEDEDHVNSSPKSAVVTFPISVQLNEETGKWSHKPKEEDTTPDTSRSETPLKTGDEISVAPYTQKEEPEPSALPASSQSEVLPASQPESKEEAPQPAAVKPASPVMQQPASPPTAASAVPQVAQQATPGPSNTAEPVRVSTTPLAFRGSPERPQHIQAPRPPINVGVGE